MFERFTESARRMLFYARLAAHEIGGDAIGVEHVCLGFLRERHTGLTHDLLGPAALSYERACAEVEAAFGQRQALPTETEIPLTDSVQQLLRRAVAEADALQHSYVGTEHLLLALLQEERPLVTAILGGDLNADSVRETIVRRLDLRRRSREGPDR
jgi:ATP-dependent Clp protease ATP-binding subunit ClpC